MTSSCSWHGLLELRSLHQMHPINERRSTKFIDCQTVLLWSVHASVAGWTVMRHWDPAMLLLIDFLCRGFDLGERSWRISSEIVLWIWDLFRAYEVRYSCGDFDPIRSFRWAIVIFEESQGTFVRATSDIVRFEANENVKWLLFKLITNWMRW